MTVIESAYSISVCPKLGQTRGELFLPFVRISDERSDWKNIGISRDTGNNLVRVAEIFGNITSEELHAHKFRSSQIETSKGQTLFDALPKTLQADISAPSELVKHGSIVLVRANLARRQRRQWCNEMWHLRRYTGRAKQPCRRVLWLASVLLPIIF